jgi:uncharacterized membrane protein YesL
MAGFFGLFDYNKPGPGVPDPADAPPKAPIVVFFEILQRKFWNLIKVNMMFLIFNIPAMIAGLAVLLFFFPNIIPDAYSSSDKLASDMLLKFILLTLMMCIPMITTGPAQAGFTYIMRNYSREEHAFLWSDFKDTALSNFKQSMIIGTINFFVTFLMLLAIYTYNQLINAGQMPALLGTALMAIMVVLFVIFACMCMYIYPIMITFKLGIGQIYKNAVIFAVMKFLPNVGILLLNAFIILLSFGMIVSFSQIIGIFLYILLTISLTGLITNFYVYPKLKKYIISRLEEDEEDDDDEDDEEEEDEVQEEKVVDNNNVPALNEQADVEDDDEEEAPANSDDEIKRYF